VKELLETMFKGWKLHEDSWNGTTYNISDIDAMVMACDGDKLKGELLYLFSYWSNDIQSIAAHYGVGYQGTIEPPPSADHWYDFKAKQWRAPDAGEGEVVS
jgi:hypothetical protein